MIARDHRHIDPGMMTFVHGLLDAFLRRVDHGSQADEDHVLLLRLFITFPVCQGKDAQRFGAHSLGRVRRQVHIFVLDRPDSAAVQYTVAPCYDRVNGALGVGHVLCLPARADRMQGRHHLPVRVERDLIKPCRSLHQDIIVRSVVPAVFDKGDLRGISDPFLCFGIILCVIACAEACQQPDKQRIARIRFLRRDLGPFKEPAHDRHPVLGQRAGLVGTDHVDRAQGLHCMDLLDDRVLSAHFPDAGREHDGHNCGQSFRNDSHRKRDGDHQRFDQFCMVDKDLADKHQDTQDDSCHAQDQRYSVQVFLERGLLLFNGLQHAGDLADLGLIPDLLNDSLAAPVFHQCRHECTVLAVSQRC